jgi:hypothetical protein
MTRRNLTLATVLSCIFLFVAFGYQLSGVSLRGMEKRYVLEKYCRGYRSSCEYRTRDLWLSDALDKAQARSNHD